MKSLQIFAGPSALRVINEQGINPNLFSAMLGASGGPKWFTLLGLDRYLFGQFFSSVEHCVHLIGSSAGAFRFAALSQQQPDSAIERLADHYSRVTYSDKPSLGEISDKGAEMVDVLLAGTGMDEILTNRTMQPHFITAKTNGLLAYDHKAAQLLGLARSYGLNRIKRSHLGKQYQRVVFTPRLNQLRLDDPAKISTIEVALTPRNVRQALLASGSIPMLLKGVRDIDGAPKGTYRDGGIIDYHFDFKVSTDNDKHPLVLFPHFNAMPRAGWFDKRLKRTPLNSSFDNVVMLCPTPEFIDQLPHRKIPDRNDFSDLDAKARLHYWQCVLAQSELLATEFSQVVQTQDISQIKPLNLV